MQTDIIISNIIHTGTGFAVVADNMSESVFIPSRVMHGSNARPGDRVSASPRAIERALAKKEADKRLQAQG